MLLAMRCCTVAICDRMAASSGSRLLLVVHCVSALLLVVDLQYVS